MAGGGIAPGQQLPVQNQDRQHGGMYIHPWHQFQGQMNQPQFGGPGPLPGATPFGQFSSTQPSGQMNPQTFQALSMPSQGTFQGATGLPAQTLPMQQPTGIASLYNKPNPFA